MRFQITYFGKFEKNGKIISGIWCGSRPEDATITEEREILFPDEGKKLKHKETGKIFSLFLLHDDVTPNDFEEIEERLVNNDIVE